MNLTFDAELRLRLPEPDNRQLQNLYFFNLYRSGSSLVEAIAESLAKTTGRTPLNLSRMLYELGVEYFDSRNFNQSSVHLANGAQLEKLTQIGGYMLYGFREVPADFAEAFRPLTASVLVVRDPRDIGISQYQAVAKHAMDNRILASQIGQLRAQTEELSLREFLLKEDTILYLNRIVESYRPMILKGMPVIQYENMYESGTLNLRLLCDTMIEGLRQFLPEDWDPKAFIDNVEKRIANSKALKNHKTGGTIYNYRSLPPDLLDELSERLQEPLALLGY